MLEQVALVNHDYAEIRDAVVEALMRPGTGILDPYPMQFANLVERVRAIFHQREGKPAPGGPQYGIRLSTSDCEMIRDVFWDMFRIGVITIGLNDSNPGFPFFRLSHFGRRILESGQPRFYDADTYVKQVQTAVPDIDPVAVTYLMEAAAAFYAHCLLASAVMLGAAAEAEFNRLAEVAARHPKHGPAFSSARKKHVVSAQMQEFRKNLEAIGADLLRAVKEQIDTTYSGIQNLLRVSRNEAGHPSAKVIDRDFAYAQLVLFIPFAKQAAATRQFFSV